MENLPFEDIKLRGDISHRILLNFSRMESKHYRPETVFTADQHGWDADWEGRTLLALIKLSQITHKEPSYLQKIMDHMPEYLNEKGYLGKVLPEGQFNEQQLSGHNWFLRAMIEYYLWKKDARILVVIDDIINNLYLPAIGHYKDYPTNPEQRIFTGEFSGKIAGRTNRWETSTDIGCAFMCLDALSQAYLVFGYQKIHVLLTEMISVFEKIDFLGLSMQTHATLSATRGIIRFYQATKETKYLSLAEKLFSLYTSQGMTDNYANKNWFGRPEWTEPCAIVDSMICAEELFKITKNPGYLELSHKILFNGLGHAQRPNGGFGCDVCVGEDNIYIHRHQTCTQDAYWCCTMRGADGLSYAAGNMAVEDGNELWLLNYNDMELLYRGVTITVKTNYPEEGEITLFFDNPTEKKFHLNLYVPSYAKKISVTANEKQKKTELKNGFVRLLISPKTERIDLHFNIPLLMNDCGKEDGRFSLWHGYLMLGMQTKCPVEFDGITDFVYQGKVSYQLKNGSTVLNGLNNLIEMEEEEFAGENRQVIFKQKVAQGLYKEEMIS